MTNKELSKLLGVSPATLSLVINNKPGLSQEMRSRVISDLSQMGYTHLIKTDCTSPQHRNISFIVYKRSGEILNSNPYFLLLMEGLEKNAMRHGCSITLHVIDKRDLDMSQIDTINYSGSLGAIIFATEMFDDDLNFTRELQMPFLMLDNFFPYDEFDSVAINNEMGTYQAIRHLVDCGHTNIGYLKSSVNISSFSERSNGFHRAASACGITIAKENIYCIRNSEEGSYQDFGKILRGAPQLPTAFVTDDDTLAIGVIRALSEVGYTVPKDVSIIGFNDRPVCQICSPPLSSVRVSTDSLVYEAVELLMRRIHHSDRCLTPVKIRVSTTLVHRDSVRPLHEN